MNAASERGYAHSIRWVVPLYAALCVVSGCGDDDSDGTSFRRGCPRITSCDLREAACQKRWFELTACVADMTEVTQPPVRTQTLEEFEREVRAEVDEARDQPDVWSAPLQLLGLIPQERSLNDAQADQTVASVAAYYNARTKQVTVIDRGDELDGDEQASVLAHEFVHALRDAETDLIDFQEEWATSLDSSLAITSLIESEALIVGTATYGRSIGRALTLEGWRQFADRIMETTAAGIDESVDPFSTALSTLPYALGLAEMGPGWADTGRSALDARYAKPYLSVARWLGAGVREGASLDCFPTAAPEGFVAQAHERFGGLGVLVLRVKSGESALEALDAIDGWTDDSLVTFHHEAEAGTQSHAAAWRIRFADAERAKEFREKAALAVPEGARIELLERDVVIANADDPDVLMGWGEIASCGSAEDLPVEGEEPIQMMMTDLRR